MKNILIIIFISILFFSNAQLKKVNLLIIIDEKPCLLVNNLQINSKSLKAITADYIFGTIDFTEDNYQKFINDKSPEFNLNFETILSNHSFPVNYLVTIPKSFLKQKYVIINIFNMDIKTYKKRYSKLVKNNKKYYVVMETPNSMKFD